jgi:hypothetical protein
MIEPANRPPGKRWVPYPVPGPTGTERKPSPEILKKLSVQYDRSVTICIAAACEDKGKPAIVLCADKRLCIWDGVFSSDMGAKMLVPAPGWCALLSGPHVFAKRLAWECGNYLKHHKISHVSVQQQLLTPIKACRKWLMDEQMAKWGISYKQFIAGEVKESGLLKEIRSALRKIRTDYSVILTGFVDGSPMIVKIENGDITSGDTFSLIGSGLFLAWVPLNERDMGALRLPLEKAAYMVYEAKRFSEKNADVDKKTEMVVQYEDYKEDRLAGHLEPIQPKGLRALGAAYSRLALPPLLRLPSSDELFSV